MSEEMELEGEWVMGWPDRKRARVMPSKDAEGRTIFCLLYTSPSPRDS